jgi:hypothetical protein
LKVDKNDINGNDDKRKRAVNGAPLYAVVEQLAVVDYSNFVQHSGYANTSNLSIVLMNMRIYFAHLAYGVCL